MCSLADVGDVVLRKLLGGEHERLDVFDVIHVLLGQHEQFQCGGRGVGDVLEAMALGRENDFAVHIVFAAGLVVTGQRFLNHDALLVSVVVARDLEFGFVLREFLDDVVHRNAVDLCGRRAQTFPERRAQRG